MRIISAGRQKMQIAPVQSRCPSERDLPGSAATDTCFLTASRVVNCSCISACTASHLCKNTQTSCRTGGVCIARHNCISINSKPFSRAAVLLTSQNQARPHKQHRCGFLIMCWPPSRPMYMPAKLCVYDSQVNELCLCDQECRHAFIHLQRITSQ